MTDSKTIIDLLCGASTPFGSLKGFTSENETPKSVWIFCEPTGRKRLDHYVGSSARFSKDDDEEEDSQGWDEEAWYDEYANPLATRVREILNKGNIPRDKADIEIGEKGHVEIFLRKK